MCFPRYQGSLSLQRQKGILSHQQINHCRIDYISISENPSQAVGRAGPERQRQGWQRYRACLTAKNAFQSKGTSPALCHSQHPWKNLLKDLLLHVEEPLCYESQPYCQVLVCIFIFPAPCSLPNQLVLLLC